MEEHLTTWARWMGAVADSQGFSGRSPHSNGLTNFMGHLPVLLSNFWLPELLEHDLWLWVSVFIRYPITLSTFDSSDFWVSKWVGAIHLTPLFSSKPKSKWRCWGRSRCISPGLEPGKSSCFLWTFSKCGTF